MSSHFSSLNLRNVTGRRYILSLVTVTQHFLLLYLLRQEIRTTFTVLSLTVPTIPSGLIIEQCKIRRRDILLCNIKIRSWVDGSNTSLWYFQPSGLSVIQTQLSTVAGRDLVRDSQTSEEQPVMLLTLRLLLLARTAMLMSMSESVNLLKCVNVNEIVMFPDDSDECCGEGEWMILTKAGDYRCDAETKCEDQNNVMYDGVCRDVFEDGVCGPEALGERLYLGEDGLGYCDCAEGWVRHEGRCYQEFTPAFCPEDKILRLGPPDPPNTFLTPTELRTLKEEFRLNISCVDNPCLKENTFSLPHSSTWAQDRIVCHTVTEDISQCEVFPGPVIDDGPSPLVCCLPENRKGCLYDGDDTFFLQNCPGSCKCPKGMIWSRFLNPPKCVRKYSARIIN